MPTQAVKDKNTAKFAAKVESLTKALATARAKETAAIAKREAVEKALKIATADHTFWTAAPVDGVVDTGSDITVEDEASLFQEQEDVLV